MSADEPLRIVTLVNRIGERGGAERLAVDLAAGLARRGAESTLCVSRLPRAEDRDDTTLRQLAGLEEAGAEVLGLERRTKMDVWNWAPFPRYLAARRVQVVHAHMLVSNAWATLLGRLAGTPVIVSHEHTWSFEGQRIRQMVDRHLIARGSDAFIAVSSEDRRRMIEIEGVDPAKATVVPNGIGEPAPPSGADVRAELGLGGRPVAGAIARLEPQKGLDVLVRASALLRDRIPDLAVVLAGKGSEHDRLTALIAELGLEDCVYLVGHRPDVPDLLAAIDVAVFPSRYEGSPLSVIESMAAGRAIVATRVGGVPDLIEHEAHGLLVEPEDPAALSDALARVLGDPDLAGRLGGAARDRQLREFGMDAMLDRLEALYAALLRVSATRAGYPLPPLRAADRLLRLAGR